MVTLAPPVVCVQSSVEIENFVHSLTFTEYWLFKNISFFAIPSWETNAKSFQLLLCVPKRILW